MFKLFIITVPVFFAVDMVWLGLVANNFYKDKIGGLMRTEVLWAPAILFYLLFVAGLVYFVINPAIETGSWVQAAAKGALFGLITYATYDLTNLATLKDWPLSVAIVDLIWGTALGSIVSVLVYAISSRIAA